MKPLFALFLLSCTALCAQTLRNSSLLKMEWRKDLSVAGAEVSGLVLHNDNLFASQTGGTSIFNRLDLGGNVILKMPVENTRIRSFFLHDESLYSMGDQHLTRRGINGHAEFESMLIWKDGAYISTLNGTIFHDKVYTYAFGDFIQYSLKGEQVFRKEVGKVCSNQKLSAGGQYIYLFSQISDPPLGSRLIQFDTLGNQKWSLDPGFVTNILTDKAGNCFVLSGLAQSHAVINKYNTEGKKVWSKEIPGQYILNACLHADSLFLCGGMSMDKSESGAQPSAFTILSASSGVLLYQQQFEMFHEGYWMEQFTQVATDGRNVYLAGKTDGQNYKCFIMKLSKEGNTTGLKDGTNPRSGYNIFPNPGGSKFTIACDAPGTGTLKVAVRNSLGQVVQKKELACEGQKAWELDLGKQPAGNYSVEIVSESGKAVKTIIVE